MTVLELITELNKFPMSMQVIVDMHSDYDEVTDVSIVKAVRHGTAVYVERPWREVQQGELTEFVHLG